MADFIKNLKGLFVVTDEDASAGKPEDKSDKKTTSAADTEGGQIPAVSMSVNAEDGEVNQEFLDILLESMTKNNQEGFDYLEYKQALQSLKKMAMDEPTKFQSAFAMAQTMGANKEQLVTSATKYLKVLKKEEEMFMLSVSNQRKEKIDDRKQEMLQMDNWIAEKQKEIELLKTKIEEKKVRKSELQSELSETAKRIESVANNFEASYQFLAAQINDDISKIEQHLN